MNDARYTEICDVSGTVSRETFDRLVAFEKEFLRWNARINLIAPSTVETLWARHVLDSAQLLPLAPPGAIRWLDLGSGGGFPGLVLAILLMDRPGSFLEMVESNRRKAGFLSSIIAKFGLPARVEASRIEDAARRVKSQDIVTARALAPLASLFKLSEPWLSNGATGLFHKGRDYAKEVKECRDAWDFDLVEHVSRTDPQSRILEISGLRARRPPQD